MAYPIDIPLRSCTVVVIAACLLPSYTGRSQAQTAPVDGGAVRVGQFDGGKMWTFEYAPRAYFADTYGAAADDAWFERARMAALRTDQPLVPDGSVDVVVSNCVLNLVRPQDKTRLFGELHRVLRRGGRAVIADIVCDEDVPEHMQADAQLWSGCIAGAYREDR